MKTFKGILFLILNIILIASNILLASSACWYLIPGLQQLATQTGGGEFFRAIFNGLNLNNQNLVIGYHYLHHIVMVIIRILQNQDMINL